jgi:hypothetical protein
MSLLYYDSCELCGTKDTELTPIEVGACGTVCFACEECCYKHGIMTNREMHPTACECETSGECKGNCSKTQKI